MKIMISLIRFAQVRRASGAGSGCGNTEKSSVRSGVQSSVRGLQRCVCSLELRDFFSFEVVLEILIRNMSCKIIGHNIVIIISY
jgi:hypothetical protein